MLPLSNWPHFPLNTDVPRIVYFLEHFLFLVAVERENRYEEGGGLRVGRTKNVLENRSLVYKDRNRNTHRQHGHLLTQSIRVVI